jgi:hypothetical protein
MPADGCLVLQTRDFKSVQHRVDIASTGESIQL